MKIDQFVSLVCETALKKTGMSVEADLDFSPHDYFDSGAGLVDQVDHASEAVVCFAEGNGLRIVGERGGQVASYVRHRSPQMRPTL